jgi:nucleotide-binding universal stress UspA family protein
MTTKPVVVCVDGSEESLRAVEWAALEAKRHSSPLRIVSAPAIVPRMHAYNASPGHRRLHDLLAVDEPQPSAVGPGARPGPPQSGRLDRGPSQLMPRLHPA